MNRTGGGGARRLFCQYVEWLKPGDAVGNNVRALHRLAEGLGYISCIVPWHAPETAEAGVVRRGDIPSGFAPEDQFHILHYAGYGYPLRDFTARPGQRLLFYHNVTPARYFLPFRNENDQMVAAQLRSRNQLVELIAQVELAVGVSEFNVRELGQIGFRRTAVYPLCVTPGQGPESTPAPATATATGNANANATATVTVDRAPPVPGVLLGSVGRLSPNKNLEAVIATLYCLRRHVGIPARLQLIGAAAPFVSYREGLERLCVRLGVREFVEFSGHVSDAELGAAYRNFDYYVCMSQHEGFCVPVLEAMAAGSPVLALARGAVPETMDRAGILMHQERPELAAEIIGFLEERTDVRAQVVAQQRKRIGRYRSFPFAERLAELLNTASAPEGRGPS